ncbi:MAG TPA: DNA repair protein RadC [Williamwhitmania sp.]|nr:DNA repair protein RadC [Williamwhitmania sp.]
MEQSDYRPLTIKEWAVEDRPREKLLTKGTAALSDAEHLAILIGSGTKKESAVELSRRMLQSVSNNLDELGRLDVKALCRFKGIGEAKALTIVAALELGRRRKLQDALVKASVTSSQDAFNLFHPLVADIPHEEFWVLLLNRANKIIGRERTSMGGVSGTVVDLKLILKRGLEVLASSIILCHNHPSGNNKPSDHDKQITQKVKQACELLDISLLDHIIVAGSTYFSFADEGLL